MNEEHKVDLLPLWDRFWGPTRAFSEGADPMGNDKAFRVAAEWLNLPEIGLIEDWGCGHGNFQRYIAPHQTYRGIDGSKNTKADIVSDLRVYESKVPGIHLRGVLEHIVEWQEVLDRLLQSAQIRAAVTLFKPMVEEHIIGWTPFNTGEMCWQKFTMEELSEAISPYLFTYVKVPGKHNEETVILIDCHKEKV